MRKLSLAALVLASAIVVSACGSKGQPALRAPRGLASSDGGSFVRGGIAGPAGPIQLGTADSAVAQYGDRTGAPVPAPKAASVPPNGSPKEAVAQTSSGVPPLDSTGRKTISSGSVSLEVTAVQPAIAQIRAIAEGLGGFVGQLNSSGDPDRQHASVTVRVPEKDLFTALERIEAMGKVLGQNMGSEDVSEQYIDLTARLKSARTQEASYLNLLSKVTSISDILTIEQQLTRVRAEVEKLQGQLAYLDRRVELATINVSLTLPAKDVVTPPAAGLTVAVGDVGRAANEVKAMVSVLQGSLESSSFQTKDGHQTAVIFFRVYSADFEKALASVEGKGRVESKDVREGGSPGATKADKPDSRIQVSIVEPEPSPSPWTPIGVGATMVLGIIAIAAGASALTKRLLRPKMA